MTKVCLPKKGPPSQLKGYLKLDSKHLYLCPSFSCKQFWPTWLPWTSLGIRTQKDHLKQHKQKQGKGSICNAKTSEIYIIFCCQH
jgi:hypothetical protein